MLVLDSGQKLDITNIVTAFSFLLIRHIPFSKWKSEYAKLENSPELGKL